MSGGWHKDSVYLSTTLAPVLSLHSPHAQAPDIPAEATYPPLRLYPKHPQACKFVATSIAKTLASRIIPPRLSRAIGWHLLDRRQGQGHPCLVTAKIAARIQIGLCASRFGPCLSGSSTRTVYTCEVAAGASALWKVDETIAADPTQTSVGTGDVF